MNSKKPLTNFAKSSVIDVWWERKYICVSFARIGWLEILLNPLFALEVSFLVDIEETQDKLKTCLLREKCPNTSYSLPNLSRIQKLLAVILRIHSEYWETQKIIPI